ncbi:MAG TPA: TRAP transporter large permease [Marinagarivorans sp.]
MITVAVVFTVLLVLRMPLAFAVGIAGASYFVGSEFLPLTVAVQRIASASQSFPLLAVPFFILAGQLMNISGITTHLIRFSQLLVSWISGGLAHVSIVLSAMMGGVSGSAVADASMQARVLGPSMIDSGLSKGFTSAAIAVGALITATIPPSIGLILYGFMGNVSIGKLFIAGLVPGLLMTLVLMLAVYWVAKRRGIGAQSLEKPTAKAIGKGLLDAKWAVLFPVLLIITIRWGIFTPSEAGAFAVVYALAVGHFAYRNLTFNNVFRALQKSVNDIGMIMLIILFANIVSYAIAFEQLPQAMTEALVTVTERPTVMLLLILAFLGVIGMVMEATVIVLLLTPILVPVVTAMGIDPVHFGILMMIMVTLGGMTPPVGVAMYAVCGILKCPTERYVVESLPLIFAVLLLVVFLALVPSVVLFLPNGLMS